MCGECTHHFHIPGAEYFFTECFLIKNNSHYFTAVLYDLEYANYLLIRINIGMESVYVALMFQCVCELVMCLIH